MMLSGKDLHFRSNFDLLMENFLSIVLKCRILVLLLCILNPITMSKKKKKANNPQTVTAPTDVTPVPVSPKRRSQQKYPKTHLLSVADRIFSMRPTLKEIENTIRDIYISGVEAGMVRQIDNMAYFKMKRGIRQKHSFNMALQNIENLIHGGVTKPVEK